MRKTMRAIPSLLLLLLVWPGVAAAPPVIKPDRTIRLVDGKDLIRSYTWLMDHRKFS
jgi:hypothetical protein